MQLKELLEQHGQGHICKYLDALDDPDRRQQLEEQLRDLEWDQIDHWIEYLVCDDSELALDPDELEPPPHYPLAPENSGQAEKYKQAEKVGIETISAGRLAAFTVAGGQGTRLGFDAPKGTFPISPIRQKSLFQLFAETLLRQAERFDCRIPWYIMTSPKNDRDTQDFFDQNNYFGLNARDVRFFIQGQLPAFDFDGRLLMQRMDQLAMSPDGHGGSLKAMYRSGAVDEMSDEGIEIISYFQVDNPLVPIVDPVFVGLHRLDESPMSNRMISKKDPEEKVGLFCRRKGRTQVIEYSDFPAELADRREDGGKLRFRAGSPAVHLINRDFVAQINQDGFSLPLHRAEKKVPHVRPDGTEIDPDEPNGVKLESFVFDALLQVDQTVIYEMDRETTFAPVKNAEGRDSPDSCRRQMQEVAAAWLERRGVHPPRDENGELTCKLEISPRSFVDEDDFQRASLPSVINPGEEVYIE